MRGRRGALVGTPTRASLPGLAADAPCTRGSAASRATPRSSSATRSSSSTSGGSRPASTPTLEITRLPDRAHGTSATRRAWPAASSTVTRRASGHARRRSRSWSPTRATAGRGCSAGSRAGDAARDVAALRRARRAARRSCTWRSPRAAREPAFAPEPITADDLAAWTDGGAAPARRRARGRARRPSSPTACPTASTPLASAASSVRVKLRHHGDFHLGQTLYRRGGGDFDDHRLRGRAAAAAGRAPAQARAAPRRGRAAALARATPRSHARPAPGRGSTLGGRGARRRSSTAIARRPARRPFLPAAEAAADPARVAAFEVEKAAYEVVYEANNRPDWIGDSRCAASSPPPRLFGRVAGLGQREDHRGRRSSRRARSRRAAPPVEEHGRSRSRAPIWSG